MAKKKNVQFVYRHSPLLLKCAVLATVAGFLIALLNFQISKKALRKNPNLYLAASTFRLVITVVFVVVSYLFAEKAIEESFCVLIGGVLGVTLTGFYFTSKLLKLNSADTEKDGENADG